MNMGSNGLPPRDRGDKNKKSPSKKKVDQSNKKKRKSPFHKFMKIVMILVILGVVAGIGYLYMLFNNVIDTGNNSPVAAEDSAKVKPLTMLILGTDYREETKTHLTDVVMVASMNPKTDSVTLVSLPRDTLIKLDGYSQRKLNSYYPRFKTAEKESGVKAEEEMRVMLSKYLDVNIDYVTVLNFKGFTDAVDALGGVDVNATQNMCYNDTADGTKINITKGPQHLDGDEALDYVRYRKSNCDPQTPASDDFSRNQRQNEVLHSMLDQMKSLGGVTKIGKVVNAVSDNMTTTVESEQMKNFIAAYWDMSKENVNFVPVTGTWNSPYVYINEGELSKAKEALAQELAGNHISSETTSGK
ncbi:LCP family protein [Paenibacillus sp. Marseille-Q4541]|uniref:LCP family protein n=1 Tax=Paenibacillus sp. Marseille-Q4541 TaxID=2831522 RepID=UPI001BA845E0|nr:LCP family protein [Paenibacillus sp. Marseille-Q4541]